MGNILREIDTNDNSASNSKCKNFIGVKIYGKDGKPMNGEVTLNDGDGTIVRFVDGFIDGNVYDKENNIVEQKPALVYSHGGCEFWTKGKPHGYPAVVQNFGYHEEDWENGQIKNIRTENIIIEDEEN